PLAWRRATCRLWRSAPRSRRARIRCRKPATSLSETAGRRPAAHRHEVLDTRVPPDKALVHHPDRPVTLLADNDLRHPLGLHPLRVVHLMAIDEHDHVRILFYRSTFTKIRHHGPFVGALFQAA